MLENDCVSPSQTSLVSDISAGLRNVFYAFACNCKQNIAILKIFRIRYYSFICMRNAFIEPHTVCCINFSVTDTRNTYFLNLVTLNARTTINICRNIPKRFIFYTIRAKFLYQLIQFTHTPTSISAISFAISSRRTCSWATISSISALSLTISIFSRVSSCST